MSGFQTVNKTKKWADSETESEGENHKNHADDELISAADGVPAQQLSNDIAEKEPESDSDSSSEDEDDESNKLNLVSAQPVQKKEKVKQLSKKEKLELRQKELNALDSILAELGVESKSAVQDSAPVIASAVEASAGEGEKKDKKKKKKPAAAKKVEAPAAAEEPVVVVADAKELLKARTSQKKKAVVTSDAQKIAMAEIQAANSKKNKKADKSKFCEYSY